jgi:hypothetical protein
VDYLGYDNFLDFVVDMDNVLPICLAIDLIESEHIIGSYNNELDDGESSWRKNGFDQLW